MRARAILGLTVVLGLTMVASAHGGTYVVHSCALPDGSPAPIDGWTYRWNYVGLSGWAVTCQQPGAQEHAIKAWIARGNPPIDTISNWTFTAPAETTLRGFVLYRHQTSSQADATVRTVISSIDSGAFDGCIVSIQGCTEQGTTDPAARFSPVNAVARDNLNARTLTVETFCHPLGAQTICGDGPGASVSIYAARMTLLDPLPPTMDAAPRGGLIDSTDPLAGVQSLSALARDSGGGLARATLMVDDSPVLRVKPDLATATCAQPYTAVVPCPLRSVFTINFDTRAVSNGTHRFRLVLEDVTGNTLAGEPWTATVKNTGAANGSRATALATLTGRLAGAKKSAPLHRRVSFGHSVRLTGSLSDPAGAPISGANLDVAFRVLRAGSPWKPRGTAQTDARGRWTVVVPRGSSREVRVSYRAFALDEAPARDLTARVDVPAWVRLAITPRHVGRRGTIRFRGALAGGPGRKGTQVALYAVDRRGRGRIPVEVVRCDSRGRFRYAYRFSRTPGPTTYRFVAVLARQAAYPYASGRSPIVPVRVG